MHCGGASHWSLAWKRKPHHVWVALSGDAFPAISIRAAPSEVLPQVKDVKDWSFMANPSMIYSWYIHGISEPWLCGEKNVVYASMIYGHGDLSICVHANSMPQKWWRAGWTPWRAGHLSISEERPTAPRNLSMVAAQFSTWRNPAAGRFRGNYRHGLSFPWIFPQVNLCYRLGPIDPTSTMANHKWP